MESNMNACDRLARVIVGALLVLASFVMASGWLQVAGIILGIILLGTTVLGFCPLYVPFHFSTKRFPCPLDSKAKRS